MPAACRIRQHRSRQRPYAERPSGQADRTASRYSAVPPLRRKAVSILVAPAASVRTNQHFKALLSSAAVNAQSVRTHAAPRKTPPAHGTCLKPGSAPGPRMDCLRRQLWERGGRCRRMLFPPPWFSPLGTPLSEAPPFKRKSTRGENPSGGTQHGSLLF